VYEWPHNHKICFESTIFTMISLASTKFKSEIVKVLLLFTLYSAMKGDLFPVHLSSLLIFPHPNIIQENILLSVDFVDLDTNASECSPVSYWHCPSSKLTPTIIGKTRVGDAVKNKPVWRPGGGGGVAVWRSDDVEA